MSLHVALLRAINVGGTKKVAMAELRDTVADLGYSDVRSLLHSGNLVFASKTNTGAALERHLERETAGRLGLQTAFITRTAAEWSAMIARNPFPAEAKSDPGRLIVIPLKTQPATGDVADLKAAIVGRETVHVDGRDAFVFYPGGSGASRLTMTVIEKFLRTTGTGRNWNTVMKIEALANGR